MTTETEYNNYLRDNNIIVMGERRDDRLPAPEWAENMNAYTMTVSTRHGYAEFDYFTGKGIHEADISAADVINNIMMDYLTVINATTFEEWAEELGYDTDSRKAYAVWELILDNVVKMAKLFNDTQIDELCSLSSEY